MKKLLLASVVTAAFTLPACAEQVDDATLESEDMYDDNVDRDVMPEQPVLTDPVPESTMPDADNAGDGMNPDRTLQDGLENEPMTPEEKPMPDKRSGQ